ncbi:LOW QUALITY PROTEIN: hypothetical protein IFM46972_10698 [Aspergillus udagawae]|uniref:Uncharacterized protein n=1 Tax=Aspergillus udagawae TaxID=91492 RepID=A0A8H3SDL7_9EURO|nr:LOW QUALITY PROTEIN: hypothetical protein IFM46972_10698 [Aspergillus udagawae]
MPASLTGQKAEAKLVIQTLFGESCDSYAEAVTANFRGRVWKIRDQSGEHTQLAYDVRGRCIRSKFQVAVEYKAVLDWNKKENTELDSRSFETRAEFDNFGSPVWDVDVQRNETRRVFSRRGHASKVEVRHVSKPDEWQTYLVDTAFEADGLPLSVTYGNGTRTTFTYQPRSRHLLTQRTVSLKPGNGTKGEEVKEHLSFTYDIVRRRVSRSNKADKLVFVGGTRISADFTYSYDVIGQLVSATGRGQPPAGVTRLQPYSAMSGNTDRICSRKSERWGKEELYLLPARANKAIFKGTERVQLTNVPALRKNAIEAFGKREHDSKSYMETIWDSPPQVTRGMTHDATKAAMTMQNDWQVAQMSRTDLNRAFGIMEKKLKTVGDSLWDSRTTDPKKLPAMTFRETIRRPLDVLKEENSYVGISSDKFISDQKRYQAVEKAVSGLVSFANEKLGPDGPTAQQAKALQTVMNQRDGLARLWERSILDQEVVRDNSHSNQVHTLTKNPQCPRGWHPTLPTRGSIALRTVVFYRFEEA